MNSKLLQLLVLISSMIVAQYAVSDVAPNKRHEIQFLLAYVRDSACVIDSEGEKLRGLYASAHIQQQYKKYQRDINTAETFIEYTAAKSSVLGKYSMVHCDGRPLMRTIDWLQRALNIYRIKRRY